jgi:hypothetical protein
MELFEGLLIDGSVRSGFEAVREAFVEKVDRSVVADLDRLAEIMARVKNNSKDVRDDSDELFR